MKRALANVMILLSAWWVTSCGAPPPDTESLDETTQALTLPNSILWNTKITNYTVALESKYTTPGTTCPASLGGACYNTDFLCSATGVAMQGTGITNDGHHVKFSGGGGGWDQWPNPTKLADCNSASFTYSTAVIGADNRILVEGYSIAVDNSVFPKGSYVYIDQLGHWFRVDDTGGKVQGKHIDVYIGTGPNELPPSIARCKPPFNNSERCSAVFVTNTPHLLYEGDTPFSSCGDGVCENVAHKWQCPAWDGPCQKEDCGFCAADCACKYDQARACNDVPNRRVCHERGGRCENGSCYLTEFADAPEYIGTCNEGVPFAPGAKPSCINDAIVDAPCAQRCKAVNGFLTRDGRCEVTRFNPAVAGYPERAVTWDITAATCIDYPSYPGCNPLTNAQTCAAIGGRCTGNSQETCSDEFWGPFTLPPHVSTFGSCRSDVGPFNSFSGFSTPNCGEPVPNVTSTISYCKSEYSECNHSGECCAGMVCGQPLSPFNPQHDGSDRCVAPYGGSFNPFSYVGYFAAGSGSGVVQASTGDSCGSSCLIDTPYASTVVLTASANSGSSFGGWSGECASVSGNTCYVSTNLARGVKATFNPGCQPVGCAAQGKSCGTIWNGCAYETCGAYGGGCPSGQTCSNDVCQVTPGGGGAYYCYSPLYAQYGYQTWLCNPAYFPAACYTQNWQPTACPTSGGGGGGAVCGNGTCDSGESGASCGQDCCDASTACGTTKAGSGGSLYCRNMYYYDWQNGYASWHGYQWLSASQTNDHCNDAFEAQAGSVNQTQYQCGGTTGRCNAIPGGYW